LQFFHPLLVLLLKITWPNEIFLLFALGFLAGFAVLLRLLGISRPEKHVHLVVELYLAGVEGHLLHFHDFVVPELLAQLLLQLNNILLFLKLFGVVLNPFHNIFWIELD